MADFYPSIGTSTGGLIAVMLGRMHLPIDECLNKYRNVGKKVFGSAWTRNKAWRLVKATGRSPFFDIGDLQDSIRMVLDQNNMGKDEVLCESEDAGCKV